MNVLGLPRRFAGLVFAAAVIKVSLVLLTPFGGDFFNWVNGASIMLQYFRELSLPPPNAYVGLMGALAPVYWLWTILPVPHLALTDMVGHYSTSELSLVLVMKSPMLVFDGVTGFLLYKLVLQRTGVERNAWIAFLGWYLNPYNWYWIYYYGGFDVIPVAIVLLAVVHGNRGKWVRSGLCASVATILRLFPILLLPFLAFYAARQGFRSLAKMVVSLVTPLVIVFVALARTVGSLSTVVSLVATIPYNQPWLEDFWGFPLSGANVYFKLTPFLLLLQLYVMLRFWQTGGSWLEDIILASLLVMLVSQPQGNAHHFIWVSPFLSVYYGIGRLKTKLFAAVFVAAAFFPPWWDTPDRLISLQIEPFFGGLFVGLKAIILCVVNAQEVTIRSKLGPMLRYYLSSGKTSFEPS